MGVKSIFSAAGPVIRIRYLLLMDVATAFAAFALGVLVHYQSIQTMVGILKENWVLILLCILIRLCTNYISKLYSRLWRFASVEDVLHIFESVTLASIELFLLNYIIFPWVRLPHILEFSIFFVDWILNLVLLGGSRLALRVGFTWLMDHKKLSLREKVSKHRVLIMGAGVLGDNVARWMVQNPDFGFVLVGFVDDDPAKHFSDIHGITVLGDRNALPDLVKKHRVDEVIITMSQASPEDIDDVCRICSEAGVQVRISPGLYELLGGRLSIAQLRQWRSLNNGRRSSPRFNGKANSFRNILVTGGAGFIGSNFVHYMLAKYPEYRIVVYDKLTYAGNLDNLLDLDTNYGDRYVFVNGDICDSDLVSETMRIYAIDSIVNFAAETHVDRSLLLPFNFLQNNVFGTQVLLEVARSIGNIRYHQVSTDEVYGEVLRGSFCEDDPIDTRSPYSASKASADALVHAYFVSFGIPVTITRGSNNIGPYQYPEKAVPLFITNALDDKVLPVYGDGKYARDYQHVLDHCSGIDLVLHRGELGEVYNIGGGNDIEALTLAKMILDKLGKPHSLIRFVKDRSGQDRRYSLNCAKIKSLGWKPEHTFETAIEETINWYIKNDWWWKKIKSGEYLEFYEKQYRKRLDEAIEIAITTAVPE